MTETKVERALRHYLREFAILRALRGADATACCLSNTIDERTGERLHSRTCKQVSS